MKYISNLFLSFACTISCLSFDVRAQSCSDADFSSGAFCETVESWQDFASLVEDSVDGDTLYLCPFDILKNESDGPVEIEWSLSLICASTSDTDGCSIKGRGEIINLQSSGNTLIQGFTFRDGDDHAIHIKSTDNSESAIHTLCFCQFKR